jgi:hypothetical protein
MSIPEPCLRHLAAANTTVEVHDFSAWPKLLLLWQSLVDACPDATFFVSSGWLLAWMEVFGPRLQPEILLFRVDGEVVGAALLVIREHRYGVVRVTRCFLNTAGEDEGSPFIEFNRLLCLPGLETRVVGALKSYMETKRWDELSCDGFSPGASLDSMRDQFSGLENTGYVLTNHYVDLRRVRETGGYEQALGAKTRKHLRQAYRAYGEIAIDIATDEEQACGFLKELEELHQMRWKALGEPGSFASPLFGVFHRRLIALTFSSGTIQLLRFRTTGATVGFLYNFVFRGKVYFYQSGLSYTGDKKQRPGVVCIGKAVEFCLEMAELDQFHFMAGGEPYKGWLSTDSHAMEWLLLRKRNLKFHTVESLRGVKRRFQKIKQTNAPASDEPAA